jgi:hypothetical protein
MPTSTVATRICDVESTTGEWPVLERNRRVRVAERVAGGRADAHGVADEIGPAGRGGQRPRPDAEHREHAEEPDQQAAEAPGRDALVGQQCNDERQREERRRGVPDAGQGRRDALLAIGEQRERGRVHEEGSDDEVTPRPADPRQALAAQEQDRRERDRAEQQPPERHLERLERLDPEADEHEAHAPDPGQQDEADGPRGRHRRMEPRTAAPRCEKRRPVVHLAEPTGMRPHSRRAGIGRTIGARTVRRAPRPRTKAEDTCMATEAPHAAESAAIIDGLRALIRGVP